MTREQLAHVWPQLLDCGVQWRPGMRTNTGWRVLGPEAALSAYHDRLGFEYKNWDAMVASTLRLPDLEDPATVGCLLAELRRVTTGAVGDGGGEALMRVLCTAFKVEWPD